MALKIFLIFLSLFLLISFSSPATVCEPPVEVKEAPLLVGFESEDGRLFVIQQLVVDGTRPTAPDNEAVILLLYPQQLESIWLVAHNHKGGVLIHQLDEGDMITLFYSDGSEEQYQVVGSKKIQTGGTTADGGEFNKDGMLLLQTCLDEPGMAVLVVAEKVNP